MDLGLGLSLRCMVVGSVLGIDIPHAKVYFGKTLNPIGSLVCVYVNTHTLKKTINGSHLLLAKVCLKMNLFFCFFVRIYINL